MLYRTLPGTDEKLSILGYGGMRFPTRRGRIDGVRATELLHAAVAGGVNYFDTAWTYHNGASERLLGEALGGAIRAGVNIATKLPHWLVSSRQDMDRLLGAQLDRLGGAGIDYYLIHALDGPSWERLRALGVCEFLQRAREDGRIRRAGFSFHGDRAAFKRIVDGWDWDLCQIQYNFLDEHLQAGREGLQYAAARGLGVVVMAPLRGGHLAGRVPASVQAIWDQAPVQRTAAEWALRWIWNHPEVTVVLSGMNDAAHLRENLRIAAQAQPNSLSAEELALVQRAAEEYRRLMPVGCTGCGYCLPCPAGVDIPTCFELYNSVHMFGGRSKARLWYLGRLGGLLGGGTSSYASRCIGCGRCEARCPQHLPVRELLAQVRREFEGPLLKVLDRIARPALKVMAWATVRRTRRKRGERP